MGFILRLFEVRRGHQVVRIAQDTALIGREAAECDVVLDPLDLCASRVHLKIDGHAQTYHLTDLSSGGTSVNGQAVGGSGRRLYHGDVIEAGNAEINSFVQAARTLSELLDEGDRHKRLDPDYAIQCYALALKENPTHQECFRSLLELLERRQRYEDLATGGNYFDMETVLRSAPDNGIVAPIARALVEVGDYTQALHVLDTVAGADTDPSLREIRQRIQNHTGGEILKTVVHNRDETAFFETDALRVYIDERAYLADLRYVERYYKYLQSSIDALFPRPSKRKVVFHVTVRDALLAPTLPDQRTALGYYSRHSRRIFVRPRRWIEREDAETGFHITLKHEYVHFRVHDMVEEAWVPSWYNEGLAQVLSNDVLAPDLRPLARERDIPCQVSLEARMACGIGVCRGCVVNAARPHPETGLRRRAVCADGPVFDARELDWEDLE